MTAGEDIPLKGGGGDGAGAVSVLRRGAMVWLVFGVVAFLMAGVQMAFPWGWLLAYPWGSVGVLAQIGESALLYGAAIPYMFGTALAFFQKRGRPYSPVAGVGAWVWQAGVAWGIVLIGGMKGSGVAGMSFPFYIWPVLLMGMLPVFASILNGYVGKRSEGALLFMSLFLALLLLAGGFLVVFLAGLHPYYAALASRMVRVGLIAGAFPGFIVGWLYCRRGGREAAWHLVLLGLYYTAVFLFPFIGEGRPWEFSSIAWGITWAGVVSGVVLGVGAFFSGRKTAEGGRGVAGLAILLPGVLVIGFFAVGILFPSWKMEQEEAWRETDGQFFSRQQNPVLKEGSRLYGQLGCALCHSQSLGSSSEAPEFSTGSRMTLPDDYEGEYFAHFSDLSTAPVLSSLSERVRKQISLKDTQGQEIRYGTEKDWILLHLYNPRDPLFGKSWSPCPALPFLFREIPDSLLKKGDIVIPVVMPEGKTLIATAQAEQLADYLLSLDKNTKLPEGLAAARKGFLPPGRKEFLLPGRKGEPVLSERELFLKTGARVFSTQCSVCHGHDGTGDGFNYPPLAGSEWLSLPPEVLCEVVLRGLRGPLVVKGKSWDNYMTPHASRLTDEEVAAVVEYVLRRFFREPEKEVKSVMVKELRERVKGEAPLVPADLSEKYLKKLE